MFNHINFSDLHPSKYFIKLLSLLALFLVSLSATQSLADDKRSPFANGPKTIASKERVSVVIDREFSEGKKFIVLKITVPTDSQVKAFLLKEPMRVVVDFEGASIKKSDDFSAPENEVIKGVRLGAHPSKLRVVLDMRRSTPPEYDLKASNRQAVLRFFEGVADKAQPTPTQALTPTAVNPQPGDALKTAPAATLPNEAQKEEVKPTIAPKAVGTLAPTSAPTSAPTTLPTSPPPQVPTVIPTNTTAATQQAGAAASVAAANAAAAGVAANADKDVQDSETVEESEPREKVQTTFSIKGYRFETLADKTPLLKIQLNKPRAQAQISKVDEETYKIEIKDCGVENEDLELPQFPPHDFVGFVMVVAEVVGKNTEVSISVENDVVLNTSVNENEIWVRKP